jgi:hypothetical protein
MLASEGRAETDRASRYLTQLVKHFSHKTEAEFTPERGTVSFDSGSATLIATPQALIVRAEAADAEKLATVQRVVVSHAERFGAKDNLIFGEFTSVEG